MYEVNAGRFVVRNCLNTVEIKFFLADLVWSRSLLLVEGQDKRIVKAIQSSIDLASYPSFTQQFKLDSRPFNMLDGKPQALRLCFRWIP